jgi:uncharacterized protein (DUF1015 family)
VFKFLYPSTSGINKNECMALIHPFRAHRPKPEFLEEIICVPYDIISTEEAREMAEGKADSFLHVIRPEIDFPGDVSLYEQQVYERGRGNLKKLLSSHKMVQDTEPSVYIYRMEREGRSQTGIFTCVSVDDYDNEVILKHELTRPDKEDDRTKHILTQEAHAEPVMMTFKDSQDITSLIFDEAEKTDPVYSFTDEAGVHHKIWKSEAVDEYMKRFGGIDQLYIADGHHRCKSASRVAHLLKEHITDELEKEEFMYFPAVVFPMNEMHILPYNRIVYKLPPNFLNRLEEHFGVLKAGYASPTEKGEISLYLEGRWYSLKLPASASDDPVSKMDVSRLQEFLLEPLLGIEDQRRDQNLFFVGGSRGTTELEKLVDSGEAEMAISMYPTSIQELIDVSDAGLLMPPKSTWFEPKVKSGILIHTF